MEIYLRYGYAAVTEQDPQSFEISAVDDIQGCECMPKQMRVQAIYTRNLLELLEDLIDRVRFEQVPAAIGKQWRGFFIKAGALALKIKPEHFGSRISQWNYTLLSSLTVDEYPLVAQVDIGEPQAGNLGTPQP